MAQCLAEHPDQTALELLIEFLARYPERYSLRNLSALQRRVKTRLGSSATVGVRDEIYYPERHLYRISLHRHIRTHRARSGNIIYEAPLTKLGEATRHRARPAETRECLSDPAHGRVTRLRSPQKYGRTIQKILRLPFLCSLPTRRNIKS